MKKLSKGKLIITLIFLNFFSFNTHAALNSSIMARVGNSIITKNQIEERYKFIILTSNIKVKSAQEKNIILNRIIDKMIDEELIRQEAQNLGITIDSSEILETIRQTLKQNNQSVEGLRGFFTANGISFTSYTNQVTTDLLWTKIITQHLKKKVSINDSEVKELLEQHNIEAKTVQFRLGEIFIPKGAKDSKAVAEKLAEELSKGADFNKIVAQFSSNVTAQNNGDLGFVDAKSLNKEIYAKISKLQKGQYSEVISGNDGYRIFKILDKKTSNEADENDMQAARNAVFINKLQIAAKSYLIDLRKNYFIENSYY